MIRCQTYFRHTYPQSASASVSRIGPLQKTIPNDMKESDFNLGDELKIKYSIERVHLVWFLDDDDGHTRNQNVLAEYPSRRPI